MSNARVLMQKIHAARDVENSEIPEIASFRKLIRDIASQLVSLQLHVEHRDIRPVQTHESDCFCDAGCHTAYVVALIEQCRL